MTPVIGIFDNFFSDPERVFNEISAGSFRDYKSPWDDVVYPFINDFIPRFVSDNVEDRLKQILGTDIVVTAMFARATPKKIMAPHKIHSDKIMGQYSAHVYLSQSWPVGSGTAFWMHNKEGHKHTDETDVVRIQRDQNDDTKWKKTFAAQGQFNRMVMHDACLWHSAEPADGFGETKKDSRLVLTTFFSEAK